jgi:hypothetical protein
VHPSYGTASEKPACWILGFGKLDNELTQKKKPVNLALEQAMKAQKESIGITLLFL